MKSLPRPSTIPWKANSYAVAHDTTRSITLVKPRAERQDYAATRLAPRPVGRPATAQGNAAAFGVGNVPNTRGADIGWQNEVLSAYAQVGELRYTINEMSRATSRCIVLPADSTRKSDGPTRPGTSRTSPTPPADALPVSVVFRCAQLLYLVGEYFLVSRKRVGSPLEIAVLSPTEIRRTALYWELPAPWGPWDPKNPGDLRLTRVHQPAPGCWELADAAPRSALPVLRELIGLTMQVSACIDSRLAGAGVFVYPMSAEVSAPTAAGEYEVDMPLGDAMMEAVITPISDRDTAAAHAPILLGVPDDTSADLIKHITFATPLDGQVHALRDECVRRLALAMDAPPEVLLGMQNTASHFDTWAVADDKVRTHIIPALELIVEGLSVHLDKRYTFDVSPLQQKPNLGPEAIQAYDRGELSGESLRAAIGFTEADKPDEKPTHENALALLERLIQKSPSLAQTPGLPAVYAQCMSILKGEAPDNALYPGKAIAVSEAETPRAPDEEANGRENPRSAPPAAQPRTDAPVSEGAPDRGAGGRPRQRPEVGT